MEFLGDLAARRMTSWPEVSRAVVQAATTAGLSATPIPISRTTSATRSEAGRLRSTSGGGSSCTRRQNSSQSRWSLELK